MCFSHLYVANSNLVINPTIRALVEKAIWDEIAFSNYVSPTKPRIVRALGAIPKQDLSIITLAHMGRWWTTTSPPIHLDFKHLKRMPGLRAFCLKNGFEKSTAR